MNYRLVGPVGSINRGPLAHIYLIPFWSLLKKHTYFGLVHVHKSLLYLWVSSRNILICIDIDIFKEVFQNDFLKEVFVHIHIHILNKKSVSVCIIEKRYLKDNCAKWN